MKFCMLTTFFGPHSFGGDAAFVDRLSRSLAKHGHDVHVIYCVDAFNLVRGPQSPRPYDPPPGVTIHPLSSPLGPLSPLWTHQLGGPGPKSAPIAHLLRKINPDVIHFHNLSLIGGPALLSVPAPGSVKLLTTHEHWLVCPLHVLWKHDRQVCEAPSCVSCCLHARKPPQFWRNSSLLPRQLRHLDALICPSRSTQREHARRGLTTPTTFLPYFLPDDYPGGPPCGPPRSDRPYVAAAGRFEKIKGFHDAIEAMKALPHLDLRLAGSGPFEPELRSLARGLPNVHFEGRLDAPQVSSLFRGARAVVVPSLVYETFGYVVLEAFAEATPVVVRNLGALPELVSESDGGLVFDSPETLVESLDRITRNTDLRDNLGENGLLARRGIWSESAHLDRYFHLIHHARQSRRVRPDRPHPPSPRHVKVADRLELAR